MIKQNKYEIEVFLKIKDNVRVLVDIGCRDNFDYAEISSQIEMHLFDINPEHINNLKNGISSIEHNVKLYNFGLSNRNENVSYSRISESIHRAWGDMAEFSVRKFDEVLLENKIINIDFLKMDIEGCEPDILSYVDILKGIKFIQFEYGNAWNNNYTLSDFISPYLETYDFYLIMDDNHPIFTILESKLLSLIDNDTLKLVEDYRLKDCGCNILMVNKKIKFENE